jgi:predicted Zn-dependent protease
MGAIASVRQALDQDNAHHRSRIRLTVLLTQAEEIAQAREQLGILQDRLPGHPEVQALSGWFFLRDGQAAQAVAAYQQAVQQSPRRPWVLELARAQVASGDSQGSLETLGQWLERSPDDVQVRLSAAALQMEMGEETEATTNYLRILQSEPRNVVALNNAAWLLRERETPKALELAERALEVDPDSISVLDTLGVVLFYSGDLVRSAEILERVAKNAPEWPVVHYHLARTLKEMGQLDAARQALEHALSSGAEFQERRQAEVLRRELTN